MKRMTLALLVGLTVAGCSSTDSTRSAPTTPSINTPTSRAPLSGLQDYQSVQAIADDLAAGGLTCEAPLTLDKNSRFAVQAGRCAIQPTSPDDEVVMSIYSDPQQQADAADILRQLGPLGVSYGFVTGGNWLVSCSTQSRCEAVKAIVGGRVETG